MSKEESLETGAEQAVLGVVAGACLRCNSCLLHVTRACASRLLRRVGGASCWRVAVRRSLPPTLTATHPGGLTLTALTIAMLGVKSAEEHGYVTVHWSKLSADVSAASLPKPPLRRCSRRRCRCRRAILLLFQTLRPYYQEIRQVASQSPRELQTRLDEVLSLNTPGAAGFAEGLLFSCGGRKAKVRYFAPVCVLCAVLLLAHASLAAGCCWFESCARPGLFGRPGAGICRKHTERCERST